jgi:DNA invertase Pin-like site-specific DNA recombinase
VKIGYARVSSDDQNLDLQRDALKLAGCGRIYEEKESGCKAARAELARLFEALRPGDTLVVWRLDRLGRSLKHLIQAVEQLETLGVAFKSVTEAIDTATSGGKLVFHIFAALAEFERALIRERTQAGLKAARARGRQGGRPMTLSEEKRRMAQSLRDDPRQSVSAICKTLGIAKTTFYRYTEGMELDSHASTTEEN